ncbi:HET-domain-containing protein [Apiospora arundinis]
MQDFDRNTREISAPSVARGKPKELPERSCALPSDSSIRLLRIRSMTQVGSVPSINLSVETFELDESPEFIALSYTWGDPMRSDVDSSEFTDDSVQSRDRSAQEKDEPDKEMIAIVSKPGEEDKDDSGRSIANVRNCKVTKNLHAALCHLFYVGLGDQWIWADAICINQDNEREKGVQVARMDEIYSEAQEVIVWLGADTAGLTEFAWLHGEYLDALVRYVEEHGLEEMKQQRPLEFDFMVQLDVETPHDVNWLTCWDTYLNFYRQRQWFSRSWVIQEVTLARDKRVLCGQWITDWDRLALLGELLVVLDWQFQLKKVAPTEFGRSLGDEITRLTNVKKGFQSSVAQAHVSEPHVASDVEGLPDKPYRASDLARDSSFSHQRSNWIRYFQELLSNTRSFSATDPRDKVYAIFGLLKRALPVGLSIPLTPSYSPDVTTASVFTSVTSLFLNDIPRLETLSYVEDHSTTNIQGLPSWVPDYTRDLTTVQLIHIRDPMHGFNCDPDPLEEASCRDVVSGDDLIVPGARFDHVVEICPPMADTIEEHEVYCFLKLCQGISSGILPSLFRARGGALAYHGGRLISAGARTCSSGPEVSILDVGASGSTPYPQ